MTDAAQGALDPREQARRGWRALIAMVIGFFMILLDATIVTVAMPAIMTGLGATTGDVVWVTSAYLLAFAVPLLITGRLGDRFGPKRVYLIGLTIFTIASVVCGTASSITVLIAARVVQGLGAALISPQSMAVITRLFPPSKRGAAMGVWGAIGGVAAFSGPLVGGFLINVASWEWIFRINLPVGVVAFVAALRMVPRFEQHQHRFDVLGVVLSAVGMFCLVFGLEEGSKYHWGQIWGPLSVPLLLAIGVVVMTLFVLSQRRNPEPLVPLGLFADRDFSTANVGIAAMGGIATSINIPLMFYLQTGRGLDPLLAALALMPAGLLGGVLGPFAGRYVDRTHPRHVAVIGFALLTLGLTASALLMRPGLSPWWLLVSSTMVGVANSLTWGPLSVSATRRLPRELAGAGSGVYNNNRQIGAVLVTAVTATLIAARLQAHGGDYTRAMADVMWLPAAVALVGVAASCLLRPPER